MATVASDTGNVIILINTVANDPPILMNLVGDSLNYSEGNGPVIVEQGADATVIDVDSTEFDGGNLTVSTAAGGDSLEDVLAIRNQGAGSGEIGVSGNTVTYEGNTLGTVSGGSGGTALVVTFTSNATPVGSCGSDQECHV